MIDPNREGDCMVGFCHNGTVAACFMDSLLAMFAYDASLDRRRIVEYHDASGPYIHDNRARIANYFLSCTDKQWLLMLDNDMKFPPESASQLIAAAEEHEIYLLGGAYWNKYTGPEPYCSWLVFTQKHGIIAVDSLPDLPVVPITATGMGITLIHRDVIQAVTEMHPNDPWSTFSADMLVRFEDGGFMVGRTPEDFGDAIKDRKVKDYQRMGEDVTFCLRAAQAGYLTYGLPTLVAEHYKPHFMSHGRSEAQEMVQSR